MTAPPDRQSQAAKPPAKRRDLSIVNTVISLLLGLVLLSSFFAIVQAGEQGVLLRFGRVQDQVLDEGIHFIIPLVNTVETLSVRVQKQNVSTEASSQDLQDVFTDVVLNWHILPDQVNQLFRYVGNETTVVEHIVNPAIEEVMESVIARYTAEEVITQRAAMKTEVDQELQTRLGAYHIAVDDISLDIHFSSQFGAAVEAKQIAEQEAKRAGFMAIKAAKEAQARVNLAKGEAESQQIINATLTPKLLRKQMIDHWDGKLPLIIGDQNAKLLELELDELMETRKP